MNSFILIVFPALWGSLAAFSLFSSQTSETVKLVHVKGDTSGVAPYEFAQDRIMFEIFRHGDRNPTESSIIAGSTYADESYYPEGFGQLTIAGLQKEYNIGNQLRSRYQDFLTSTWRINYLEARSTETDRTKMSLLLMLAALYPPAGNQIWSSLFWQPIPISYVKLTEDKETLPLAACRSRFLELYGNIVSSPGIIEYAKRYKTLFALLDAIAGTSGSSFEAANSYYSGFETQQEVGYELDSWTSAIYPEPMYSAAVDYYYLTTNTTAIRRVVSGYLLRKILEDTKAKINGTISPSERKMFIYSGHEFNIASMLLSLEAFKLADVPPYGSYVLFEVHEIDGVWGIKLFYQDYENELPHAIKLPNCDEFCPFDTFYSLVEHLIPTDDSDCTGSS